MTFNLYRNNREQLYPRTPYVSKILTNILMSEEEVRGSIYKHILWHGRTCGQLKLTIW
jgi:hypothetical protein